MKRGVVPLAARELHIVAGRQRVRCGGRKFGNFEQCCPLR
jgi:hypothetical protein